MGANYIRISIRKPAQIHGVENQSRPHFRFQRLRQTRVALGWKGQDA